MVGLANGLFFGGTVAIEQTGRDDRILATEAPGAAVSANTPDYYESDADDDIPYENPRTGEAYTLKNAKEAPKAGRVAGGKAAVPKRVIADYDSDDGRIIALKQQGYADEYVANKLISEGRIRYQAKTVGSRWLRLRKALEQKENDRLDDELSDWHVGEDADLHESVKLVEDKFQRELKKLTDKRWTEVSATLSCKLAKKKYSGKACKERYEAVQNGTALLPIEVDPDKEGRRILRETRIAAARRGRAEAAAEVRRAEREKAARIEAKKAEDLEREKAMILLKRKREAEKEELARIKKERFEQTQRARAAKKAAEAQAAAELKWRNTQRLSEKAVWEKLAGRKWRHDIAVIDDVSDTPITDRAHADDDSDVSDYVDDEILDREHKRNCGLLGGFSLIQAKKAEGNASRVTVAKKGRDPTVPVINAATLADPRMNLSSTDLSALLVERGLASKRADESHPQAIARLRAADQDLSSAELHDKLKRHFLRAKGTRAEKLATLAEHEAEEL
ncbi:hypothetical protein LTS10_011422 [Elasticomyces elasticus]|nr:hypothetical protein LTS10_011422 [Elasticomyces elasticus]